MRKSKNLELDIDLFKSDMAIFKYFRQRDVHQCWDGIQFSRLLNGVGPLLSAILATRTSLSNNAKKSYYLYSSTPNLDLDSIKHSADTKYH